MALSHHQPGHQAICTVPRNEARSQGQDAGGTKIVVVIGSPSLLKGTISWPCNHLRKPNGDNTTSAGAQ
jgi:hypothetical protein